MIDTAETIYIPFGGMILAAGLLLAIVAIIIRRLLKAARDRKAGHHHRHEHDWSVPVLDACSNLDSVFHRWDPRLKIFSLLVYCFLVAALTQIIWAF
ncbi:MAG: hypothetical protein WBF36_08340, partial [Desulfobulbales bacterium]